MNKQDKKDIEAFIQKLSVNTDTKIEKLKKEGQIETNELIEKLKKESEKEMKHYIGGLMEQYKWNMDAIKENLQDILEIKRMVAIMFEHMGLQEMDIALLKETAQRTKKKFQKLGV